MSSSQVRADSAPLQVSQLTRYLKYILEGDELLASLSVIGEICEFSRSPAGHQYFTLKDGSSQVSCIMFRREAARQTNIVAQLRTGITVVAHGYLTLYEPRGTYQVCVQDVQVRGDGDSARRFAMLKDKLDKEGLFAVERKRSLPAHPRALALITSPGSQAYHDVLHRLRKQYPFVRVIEAGVSVQGDGAADEIALAIDIVNRLTDAEAILVVRGGGAAEDLTAFNDERLARAIFASRIPVVTGIGHETDHTIADLVADVRAATPSLAATIVVPDIEALVHQVSMLHRAMQDTVQQRLYHERARWLATNRELLRASPQNRLLRQRQRADALLRAARHAVRQSLATKRARLRATQSQLGLLDPLAILARGYAVLIDGESGRVVKTVGAASPGQLLRARLVDGELRVRVEE